MISEEVVCRL